MNAYTNMYYCTSKEAELAAGTKFKKISAKILNNNSSTIKDVWQLAHPHGTFPFISALRDTWCKPCLPLEDATLPAVLLHPPATF